MIKKLRQNRKNKKGFTLVELIVVIVIILVLAAVMVPSVLRYVEKARQASCKADAATVLVELQAGVADAYASQENGSITYPVKAAGKKVEMKTLTFETGAATQNTTISVVGDNDAEYTVVTTAAGDNEVGDLTHFIYTDKTYTVCWTKANGWDEPYKVTKKD